MRALWTRLREFGALLGFRSLLGGFRGLGFAVCFGVPSYNLNPPKPSYTLNPPLQYRSPKSLNPKPLKPLNPQKRELAERPAYSAVPSFPPALGFRVSGLEGFGVLRL